MESIRKAAVIGSGVMGSSIAAHLANVGIPTLLLDIVPKGLTPMEEAKGLTLEDKAVRNRIAEAAKSKLLSQKPSPLTIKKNLALIEVGNLAGFAAYPTFFNHRSDKFRNNKYRLFFRIFYIFPDVISNMDIRIKTDNI